MLAQQSDITPEERKSRPIPKKNKWDEVMNKIAEGKEMEKVSTFPFHRFFRASY